MTTTTDAPISVIPKTPGEVAKAIVYIILTTLAVYRTAVADGSLSFVDYLTIIVAIIGVIPVYWLAGRWVKTASAFGLAAVQALIIGIGNAVDPSQVSGDVWIGVIFAAFAAIGIAIIPNSSPVKEVAVVASVPVESVDPTPTKAGYLPEHAAVDPNPFV